jgi:hypothetical protein
MRRSKLFGYSPTWADRNIQMKEISLVVSSLSWCYRRTAMITYNEFPCNKSYI